MGVTIFGDGNLGTAIGAALTKRGESAPRILGRPTAGRHQAAYLAGCDLAFEASRAEAVIPNVAAALAAGCRRFVIGTTGWDDARDSLDETLRAHGAAAVAGPSFSLGVMLYLRLIESAGALFGQLDGFDPYVMEWHRREKADRPSGTAREIARRLLTVLPRKSRIADASDESPSDHELEVVSLRAGASPGMHLVGFDAAGETVELRLTARDRVAYASGALAAADWLRRVEREPGIHSFDVVVDELLRALPAPALRPMAAPIAV